MRMETPPRKRKTLNQNKNLPINTAKYKNSKSP
jgi:hypothetical protein